MKKLRVLLQTVGLLVVLGASLAVNATSEIEVPANQKESEKKSFDEFFKTSGINEYTFSSNKNSIYFLKNDGKVYNVYEYSLKTKKLKQVTKSSAPIKSFYVDPKGRYLYPIKDQGGNEADEVFRFDLRTGKEKKLTESGGVEASHVCKISSDGSKLYYSQTNDKRVAVDLMYLDLKSLKPVLIKKAKGERLYCNDLSADEKYLSFIRYVTNDELNIGLINLQTAETIEVNNKKNVNNGGMVFDKSHFAFYSSNESSDSNRLWKYDLETKKSELVQLPLAGNVSDYGVGANTAFASIRGPLFPETIVFNEGFSEAVKLPFKSHEILNYKMDQDVKDLALVKVQQNGTPAKYYSLNKGKLELFYDSNQSNISDNDFAKTQSALITSFDGVKIPTHFYIPNATSAKNKRPVIFLIHGGPDEYVDPDYSPVRQFIANQGFVVVMPNFRGSSGFGKGFQDLLNGDWGGAHIKDILAVSSYVKNLEFVDRNRVYIAGGSFGGFSVMSLITQYPKEFKAAINLFGPIEMATFLNSWPATYQSHWINKLGKDPRTDEAFNRRVSPLYHINKIQIPLQVQQGANDIRIPKSQSDKLVENMKKEGRQVDYIVFENEGHGFVQFENQKKSFNELVKFCLKN